MTYHFSVGGTDYTGGRVYAGADSRSKKVALRRLAKFPAGREVAVFYDPADPASAILENGIQPGNRIAIKAGLVMTAVALLFCYWFLQVRRRENTR